MLPRRIGTFLPGFYFAIVQQVWMRRVVFVVVVVLLFLAQKRKVLVMPQVLLHTLYTPHVTTALVHNSEDFFNFSVPFLDGINVKAEASERL